MQTNHNYYLCTMFQGSNPSNQCKKLADVLVRRSHLTSVLAMGGADGRAIGSNKKRSERILVLNFKS